MTALLETLKNKINDANLSQDDLENLNIFLEDRVDMIKECPICFETFATRNQGKLKTACCKHNLCIKCFEHNIKNYGNVCPICRGKIFNSSYFNTPSSITGVAFIATDENILLNRTSRRNSSIFYSIYNFFFKSEPDSSQDSIEERRGLVVSGGPPRVMVMMRL
jgi:hypothetical protein